PPRHPRHTLFPYTTLFRSLRLGRQAYNIKDSEIPREDDSVFALAPPAAAVAWRDERQQFRVRAAAAQFFALGYGIGRYVYRTHRSEEHTSELQSPYDLVCR